MNVQHESPWRGLIGCLLLPIIIPVAIVVIPILNAVGLNGTREGPERLIKYLERFTAGIEGEWDLDDFCSVPFADPELEEIRERACRHLGSVVMGQGMTDADEQELQKLLELARTIQSERN